MEHGIGLLWLHRGWVLQLKSVRGLDSQEVNQHPEDIGENWANKTSWEDCLFKGTFFSTFKLAREIWILSVETADTIPWHTMRWSPAQ